MRARAALLAAALGACATRPPPPLRAHAPERPPRAVRERPEFSCRGPESVPPAGPSFVTTAEGPTRLTVAAVGVRARGEPVQRARVRVVALQATAGALGVELARSLGVNVWVRPNVAAARLTFAGEYTVEQLAWALRGADVRLEVHDDGGVSLGEWSARDMLARQDLDERAAVRASRAQERQMLEPVEMRLLRVPERVNAATVARIFCRHLASPSGWAAVAGRDLLVGERAGPLNQLERLVRELDRPETPPAPAPTAAPR